MLISKIALSGRSPVDTRGGQLEIAGVVVGSWRGREGPSPHVRYGTNMTKGIGIYETQIGETTHSAT